MVARPAGWLPAAPTSFNRNGESACVLLPTPDRDRLPAVTVCARRPRHRTPAALGNAPSLPGRRRADKRPLLAPDQAPKDEIETMLATMPPRISPPHDAGLRSFSPQPQHTSKLDAIPKLHERLMRVWQLAILRFAVTRDDSDRQSVLALAGEIDRLGHAGRADSFGFFRRTSTRVCAAILADEGDSSETLHRFLQEIEAPRLRSAFAAAVGIADKPEPPQKRRREQKRDLFKGLPSRSACP